MNRLSDLQESLWKQVLGPDWCEEVSILNRAEIPEWIEIESQAAQREVIIIYKEVDQGNGTKDFTFYGWIPHHFLKYGRLTKNRGRVWYAEREKLDRDEQKIAGWLRHRAEISRQIRDDSTLYQYPELTGGGVSVRIGGSKRTAAIYDHDQRELAVIYRAHNGTFIVNYGRESPKRHATLQAAIDTTVANIETLRKVAK